VKFPVKGTGNFRKLAAGRQQSFFPFMQRNAKNQNAVIISFYLFR
jgi:hypothetical protein